MYRFILFYFVLYICINVAPWSCEAQHLVPLYVHTCSGVYNKAQLELELLLHVSPHFVLLIRDWRFVLLSLLRASAFFTNQRRVHDIRFVLRHLPERFHVRQSAEATTKSFLQKHMDTLPLFTAPEPCEACFIMDTSVLVDYFWTVEQKHPSTSILTL